MIETLSHLLVLLRLTQYEYIATQNSEGSINQFIPDNFSGHCLESAQKMELIIRLFDRLLTGHTEALI
jgi:hypothetical protein